ncbi:uncharacterized protein LOC128822762 [Vidua macroura]|uniref:uncharacterized protein LOC128822762 n=1 Tax=Vidua macroura TaxID=187451 RepID=UPI0023A8FBB6|nr:uncharacterized protein LOC128822762 [Vidua macroura]
MGNQPSTAERMVLTAWQGWAPQLGIRVSDDDFIRLLSGVSGISGRQAGGAVSRPGTAQSGSVRDDGTPRGLYMSPGTPAKSEYSRPRDYVQPRSLPTDRPLIAQQSVPQLTAQARSAVGAVPLSQSSASVGGGAVQPAARDAAGGAAPRAPSLSTMEPAQMYGCRPQASPRSGMDSLTHPLARPPPPGGAPVLPTGRAQLPPGLPHGAPDAPADLISFTVPASVGQQHVLGGTSMTSLGRPSGGRTSVSGEGSAPAPSARAPPRSAAGLLASPAAPPAVAATASPLSLVSPAAPAAVSRALADPFVPPPAIGRFTEVPVAAPVPAPPPAAAPSFSGAAGSEAASSSSVLRSPAASPASLPPVSPPARADRRLSCLPPSQGAGSDSEDLSCPTPPRGRDRMSERRHRRGEQASQRELWTLPPCRVSVRPINPRRFWEAVRQRALEAGDWDLIERVLRVINTDLLAPYDIKHLASVLFQPVQFDVFMNNWRRLAERVAMENAHYPQTDPRYCVGVDALMGQNAFANPDVQATWHPIILEQAQKVGFAALMKTMETAAPKQRYVKIVQGAKELFLPFVERLAAALEKQIEDENLRQVLCKTLARENAKEGQAGTRIAQLVPFQSCVPRADQRMHGNGGFGSTGPLQIFWSAVISADRPQMTCSVILPGASPPSIQLQGATAQKGAEYPMLPLRWLVTRPVWENQWPLPHEKLVALHDLVQDQFRQGHIEPSTSPWNTPVFVIKKKSGKWRLLQDLRKVNEVMESMGALQPGMPSPTMLLAGWKILIVDLKDCFFTIPLHPDDRPKFAFTVPAINNAESVRRYQWKVLPQGCKNSPTICQWYVAQALSGVREQFPDVYCYHYMDDILVAAPTQEELLKVKPQLFAALHSYGLQVALEKVQSHPPWKYLGVKILERTIQHQEVQFPKSITTLNDAQKLLGVINWLRPYLGLTTERMSPLFNLLKGDPDLNSPRKLTPEARQALEEVQQALSARQVYRVDPSIDITVFITCPDSHPTAVAMAFQRFSQMPLNLVTDSAYVADITQRLDCSLLKEVNNAVLFQLLRALWCAIQARVHPYYILHIRSHTTLPGFITEGNARADRLANPAWVAPQPDRTAQAKASHDFFHQSAHTLQKQFDLTPTEARDIVSSCADCHGFAAPLLAGVNPRGLKALQLWQTDVTHIAKFGRLKYVHVSIDTFSSAMWASAHTGEKGRDVIAHWRMAFAVLGIPSSVKTDNGPAYVSQKTRQFLCLWGISHKFGIPHSSTGQAIVERAHGTLKRVLEKQKGGMPGETPHSRLEKALYTINHLTVPKNSEIPVILNHFLSLHPAGEAHLPRAKVWVRDLATNKWEGPCDLITWGRGYACVSTGTGVRWIPAKCVRPDLRQQKQKVVRRRSSDSDHGADHPSQSSDEDQDIDHQPAGPSTSGE